MANTEPPEDTTVAATPPGPEIMSALGRAHVVWTQWLQQVLVGQGITLPQLEALRAADAHRCLNPSQIAGLLACDRATVSCILRNLARARWITISRNPVNGKFRDVRLAPRGRAKLDGIAAHLALPGRRRFDPTSCLDHRERSALAAILEKLNEHLARAPWRGVVEHVA